MLTVLGTCPLCPVTPRGLYPQPYAASVAAPRIPRSCFAPYFSSARARGKLLPAPRPGSFRLANAPLPRETP